MNIGRLTATIIRHEGSKVMDGRHMPYRCPAGKLTIGYGRNLTDKGISEPEAKTLLTNDIQEVINGLRTKYPWFDSIDDIRQEVVINMAFNLGLHGFSKFRNTINYIAEGQYDQAASNMLMSRWAEQVGYRAQELARMMASGMEDV